MAFLTWLVTRSRLRRRTLPRRVHDQIRELALTKRCSQQELFRGAMDMLFAEEGLTSWDGLKAPGNDAAPHCAAS